MFCLPFKQSKEFLAKLKSGEIDPEKLLNMSSEERRAVFAKTMGEMNAKSVNTLFESKMLLKNQQQGIINWAKSVSGMKPSVRADIISRVEKMTEVLTPANEKAFLEDLAAHKLGVTVSMGEANQIAEMSKNITDTKTAMENGGDRLKYGKAKVDFMNYINDLKTNAEKMSLRDRLKLENQGKNIVDLGGASKSLKASFDDSAIFRQGWKTMWTHPTVWLKNAAQSFLDIKDSLKGKHVMDEVNADIVSRKNYELYKKAKLATGTIEEAYPSHIVEKVPLIGKFYKASEAAYTGFVHRMRADVMDKYIDIAKKNGVDLTDTKQIQSIGKLVNSLTGRGDLGGLESAAKPVNNIFFSPRFLKSQIDVLTAHAMQKDVTPFVRKQAAVNLMKIVGGTAAILATANAVSPGSVEMDPRSSDFGKIKIGHTRFDVSGGMASVLTLAMRELTQSSKSSTSGLVKPLNSGQFGSQTGIDVLYNFAEGKLSPIASVIRDMLKGKDFQGNKTTVGGEVSNLLMPLPIANFQELQKDPKSAGALLGTITDALGIGTNTYSPNSNWDSSASKELDQFKAKVGDDKFKQANDSYNTKYLAWFDAVQNKAKYQNLSDDDKQKVITAEKIKLKTEVFKDFGFHYKQEKSKPVPKNL